MKEVMVQCVLEHNGRVMVSWLNHDKRIKLGVFVTLEGDKTKSRWKVCAIGSMIEAKSIISAHNSGIIHDKDFVRDRKKGGFRNNK